MTIVAVDGFIDTHIHTSPAPFRRIDDTIDIADKCGGANMSGIVIKSHFETTITKVYHGRRGVPAIGVHTGNTIIATDSGQPFSPRTPNMFRSFAQVLFEKGIPLADLWRMTVANPARLLGLAPKHNSVRLTEELYGVAQTP